jgi:hypothetical protein
LHDLDLLASSGGKNAPPVAPWGLLARSARREGSRRRAIRLGLYQNDILDGSFVDRCVLPPQRPRDVEEAAGSEAGRPGSKARQNGADDWQRVARSVEINEHGVPREQARNGIASGCHAPGIDAGGEVWQAIQTGVARPGEQDAAGALGASNHRGTTGGEIYRYLDLQHL